MSYCKAVVVFAAVFLQSVIVYSCSVVQSSFYVTHLVNRGLIHKHFIFVKTNIEIETYPNFGYISMLICTKLYLYVCLNFLKMYACSFIEFRVNINKHLFMDKTEILGRVGHVIRCRPAARLSPRF